jgi:hypothetical protein
MVSEHEDNIHMHILTELNTGKRRFTLWRKGNSEFATPLVSRNVLTRLPFRSSL